MPVRIIYGALPESLRGAVSSKMIFDMSQIAVLTPKQLSILNSRERTCVNFLVLKKVSARDISCLVSKLRHYTRTISRVDKSGTSAWRP
jgi:hypothetical protein